MTAAKVPEGEGFAPEVEIASSSGETRVTPITANTADFERTREEEPLEFTAPWPEPGGRP